MYYFFKMLEFFMFPKISKNTRRFTSVHTCIKDLPVYIEINKKYMYIKQVGFLITIPVYSLV